MRLFALIALVTAIALGACGGNDDEPQPTASPTLRPTATTTTTATPATTVAPTAAPTIPPTPLPTPAPTPVVEAPPAQVVSIGNTSRMMVSLTFDAGWDDGYGPLILDTLAANGVKASFGITGRWAELYPDTLRRMVNEGHNLINHSYDHPNFRDPSDSGTAFTREERWYQLDRTEQIVQDTAGGTTRPYFRPPFGAYDDSVNVDVGADGYAYNVMWTVDSHGWLGRTAEEITQRCVDLAEPGAIYVLHLGSSSQDGPALQGIIDGLRAKGYSFGTVPDVLAP